MSQYLGVIEGFYGKEYRSEDRFELIDFIANNNLSFYIYAPKNCKHLRNKDLIYMNGNEKIYLKAIADKVHEKNLDFGIGLSPLNLTQNYDALKDKFLRNVENYIKELNLDILGLLFDDMFKDSEHIGLMQNKIIKDVFNICKKYQVRLITCPSYYSYDKILDKLFGVRPKTYFEEFCQDLDNEIDIFWTGENILSKDITKEHLKAVFKILNRKVFLWDNYPVNDGRIISNYLFLNPFYGRRNISEYVSGHAINPMNEPHLSYLPIATLPLIYNNKSDIEITTRWQEEAKAQFKNAYAPLMKKLDLLTTKGLNNLTCEDKKELLDIIKLDKSKALNEIKEFLEDYYHFDPNILN